MTSASSSFGDCLFGSNTTKVCHTLGVHIVNGNAKENVDNNMFYWEGASANGGIFKAPVSSGPDAIAAGSQGNVTLKFDVTDGSNLVTLQYKAVWMSQPITAAVLPYGSPTPANSTKSNLTYRMNLSVHGYYTTTTYGGQASPSAYWLIVNVTAENNGTGDLPTSADKWELTDVDGFFIASASAQFYVGPSNLHPGQNLSVSLAFSAGQYDSPAKVEMALPSGETVAAILHK